MEHPVIPRQHQPCPLSPSPLPRHALRHSQVTRVQIWFVRNLGRGEVSKVSNSDPPLATQTPSRISLQFTSKSCSAEGRRGEHIKETLVHAVIAAPVSKRFSASDVRKLQHSIAAKINGFLPPVLPHIIIKSYCWSCGKRERERSIALSFCILPVCT